MSAVCNRLGASDDTETRIHAYLVSDIVSAVARNRPTARIESGSGTIDLVSALTEALAYEAIGVAFVDALSDVLSGKDASKLADWVQQAATKYADMNADVIAMYVYEDARLMAEANGLSA